MSGESLWSESEGPCTHHDVLTLNHVASHEVDYKVDSNTQSRWVFLQPNNKEPRSTLDTFYIRACATSGRTFAPRSRHNVQHSWPFSISNFDVPAVVHPYNLNMFGACIFGVFAQTHCVSKRCIYSFGDMST